MAGRFRAWLWRLRFNLFPAYFGSGARVSFVAPDWSEVRVTIPLSWRTRNYVGTTFGGSMYAAVDPVLMMMFIMRLGRAYIVWDKAAAIRFHRPGRAALYATFLIDDAEVREIRSLLDQHASLDRVYHIDIVDRSGVVHASVEKTLYFRKAGVRVLEQAA